jgi:hypothetical protein
MKACFHPNSAMTNYINFATCSRRRAGNTLLDGIAFPTVDPTRLNTPRRSGLTIAPWQPSLTIDIALVEKQMQRWGDEVLMHHEFGRQFGGCMVFDNHVYTIEDGGMREIDTNQIDFKKLLIRIA